MKALLQLLANISSEPNDDLQTFEEDDEEENDDNNEGSREEVDSEADDGEWDEDEVFLNFIQIYSLVVANHMSDIF